MPDIILHNPIIMHSKILKFLIVELQLKPSAEAAHPPSTPLKSTLFYHLLYSPCIKSIVELRKRLNLRFEGVKLEVGNSKGWGFLKDP